MLGTIAFALGTLAATLERYEEAEGHFATAAEIDESLGAPLLLASTHAAWARTLIARGRPEDLEHAQPMLDKAEDTAGQPRRRRHHAGSHGLPRRPGCGQQLIGL
jgi:hypothetical protein